MFLNYLSEMQVTLFEHMEYLLTGRMNYSDLYFSDRVASSIRDIPFMNRARRDSIFLAKSIYYFLFTDFARTDNFILFKEDLRNLSDFNTDPRFYRAILDPKKYEFDYFRSPGDPYILHEHDYDNVTTFANKTVQRRISEDFLGQVKHKRLFYQRDLNNTQIMRGFHITVRDFYTNEVINNEYGHKGGPDFFPKPIRDTPGKVFWYRPADHMDPRYVDGMEDLPENAVKRDPLFDIELFERKWEQYFAKVKRSLFLPRCLKDAYGATSLNEVWWVRCPKEMQGTTNN